MDLIIEPHFTEQLKQQHPYWQSENCPVLETAERKIQFMSF